jgi:pectate lyase
MWKVIALLLLSFQAFAASDIIVTSLDYDDGKFTSVLKNQGTKATPTTYISISFLIVGVEHSYGKVMGPIAPGATLTLSSTAAKPLTSGSYVVTAFADNLNRIAESDEANNRLTKIITVEAPTVPPPTSETQGFAAVAGVTGGAGGTHYIVTTGANSGAGSLYDYLNRAGKRVITFKPGLTAILSMPPASPSSPYMYLKNGDVTLDGVGANITITRASIGTAGKNNIIIKNMTFKDNIPNGSAIFISYGSYNVWVDHCTFSGQSSGSTSGQPIAVYNNSSTGLDATTQGLTGITISWNRFKAPNSRGFSTGSETHNTGNKTTVFTRISMHHNFWDNCTTRNPRAHSKGSTIHEWNSYATAAWSEAPVTINQGAAYYGQGNIYEPIGSGTKQITNNRDYYFPTDVALGIKSEGYYLLNGAKVTQYGSFPMDRITYTANIEPANNALKTRIIQKAGANRESYAGGL